MRGKFLGSSGGCAVATKTGDQKSRCPYAGCESNDITRQQIYESAEDEGSLIAGSFLAGRHTALTIEVPLQV